MDGDLNKVTFNDVWHVLCTSHYRGEASSAYLIERTLMRPRNLLKLFNHCRGFATNFNREAIDESDIEKGVKAYSADLLEELDREVTDVFPSAGDLLYHFLDTRSILDRAALESIYKDAKISPDDYEKVTDFLLYYGVLGIQTDQGAFYIYTVNYDLKILKIRAGRGGVDTKYVINQAFHPALAIQS